MSNLSLSEFLAFLHALPRQGDPYEVTEDGILIEKPNGERWCYRIPLILNEDTLQYPSELINKATSKQSSMILLMQAGDAVMGLVQAETLVASRTIRKYMVRKSQGKAQYSYLKQRGKSRLGSRIRLRETEAFFAMISEQLSDWMQEFKVDTVFLSCAPPLKGAWYSANHPPPLDKQDRRWRRIPFSINRPAMYELKRIHRLLCESVLERLDLDIPQKPKQGE